MGEYCDRGVSSAPRKKTALYFSILCFFDSFIYILCTFFNVLIILTVHKLILNQECHVNALIICISNSYLTFISNSVSHNGSFFFPIKVLMPDQ